MIEVSKPETTPYDFSPKSILAESAPVSESAPLVEHDRWHSAKVPAGYSLTRNGVHKMLETGPSERFCGPICVIAETSAFAAQDEIAEGAGLLVEFENRQGRFKTVHIDRKVLIDEPKKLGDHLAPFDFYILPGKLKELQTYLSKCISQNRLTSVSQTGWTSDKELIFILPAWSSREGYIYHPEEQHTISRSVIYKQGTLREWYDNVFSTEPYPLFFICYALSSTLLKSSGVSLAGTLNLFANDSSVGKTTLLQIAASLWGNSAEPGKDPRSYIQTYNSSVVGLEATFAAFNDLPVIIDELGQFDGNLGIQIYNQASGKGKRTLTQSRDVRKDRTWRNNVLTSGEVTAQSKIEEEKYNKKKVAKGGQMVRMTDIEIKKEYTFADRTAADNTKESCSKYFGTLGPAFVEHLCTTYKTTVKLEETVQFQHEKALTSLIAGRKLNNLQIRVLKRFALVIVAGRILVQSKLIPLLTFRDIENAVTRVANDWLPRSTSMSDSERAITALREYLQTYRDSRIKNLLSYTEEKDKKLNEISGFIDREGAYFYLYPRTLKDATGVDADAVAAKLRERCLLKHEQGRLTQRATAFLGAKQEYFYCVSSKLLEGERTDPHESEGCELA